MIRAGVPQPIAMRVTGHETDAMFNRYDITDNRDKAGALEAARRFVADQSGLAARLGTIKTVVAASHGACPLQASDHHGRLLGSIERRAERLRGWVYRLLCRRDRGG